MSGHTPGPWHTCTPCRERAEKDPNKANPCALVMSDHDTVACIRHYDESAGIDMDGPTRLANWKLIAAAPQLLEALKGMQRIVCDSHGVDGFHMNGDTALWGEFPEVEAMDAALALAEPGSEKAEEQP